MVAAGLYWSVVLLESEVFSSGRFACSMSMSLEGHSSGVLSVVFRTKSQLLGTN